MANFWHKLKAPIFCLAPMADVTDAAFRFVISKYSKKIKKITPHSSNIQGSSLSFVTYTEFTSADGLVLAPKEGKKKLLKNLEYSEIERPIVAQFFTSKPEMMKEAAKLAVKLGFDGVDINMGCPDKKIEKQNAGAALIKNPKLAQELILAAKDGVKEAAKKLNKKEIPVSVKTRIGWNKNELETWLPALLEVHPAAIVIHARTRKELSLVTADWSCVKQAVGIRDSTTSPLTPLLDKGEGKHISHNDNPMISSFLPSPASRGRATRSEGDEVLIIGNGDVKNLEDAYKKVKESGCDGVMIGRGIFGNPWVFANYVPTAEERLKVLLEHTKLFEKKFKGFKNFAVMKKHFKSYVHDLPNSKSLRLKLMETKNSKEVQKVIEESRSGTILC